MRKKKVVKRKIKWKSILKIVFFLLLFSLIFIYLWNLKTNHIFIKGNSYVSDNDIILASGFKNYPYLFREKTKDIETKILNIPYIDSVNIHKSIFGTLTIEITEATPLFFNRNNNKLVLTNKSEIESDKLDGVPILINYVPDSYYNKLIEKLSFIDFDVIALISEMEYSPWTSNDVVIDSERFFLRMTDGNSVYTNLLHMDKLNNYIEIFATLEGKKGTLYLDSSSDKISFSEYS